jgi:ubiquinol-cytochrome c reductase iron-sulfur subunit
VRAEISRLEPGQMIRVEWRGKPVWIVKRTEQNLQTLESMDQVLADPGSQVSEQPGYAQNAVRSIKPEILVLTGICTHLGCSPTYRPDVAPVDLGPDWQGGFFCPCHGSKFDIAGRVFKGMPAPTNLPVPPYRYLSDAEIIIGEDEETA